MTIAEATTTEQCPKWCTSCTPAGEGGFGHTGELVKIGLSLEEPTRGHDTMFGMDSYTPAELSVSLQQRHGAVMPTVDLSIDHGGIEGSRELTIMEAIELHGGLGELIDTVMNGYREDAEST
jgi:hypothetical protein